MKAIVEAITEIGEDVKTFEAHPNLPVDVSKLESLKHESTNRLNNLMQAARNHAMAQGLSPVSLIDGAAGHLSANVVEIIKLLKIRRSDKLKEVRRRGSTLSIGDMVRRSSGDLKKVNGNYDKEYPGSGTIPGNGGSRIVTSPVSAPAGGGSGIEERLREPGVFVRRPSEDQSRSTSQPLRIDRLNGSSFSGGGLNTGHGSGNGNGPQPFRINSFQSASSAGARSDSFDLERKASVASQREGMPPRVVLGSRGDGSRGSLASATSTNSGILPVTARSGVRRGGIEEEEEGEGDPRDEDDGFAYSQNREVNEADMEREWEELKVSWPNFDLICQRRLMRKSSSLAVP
jgi:hypothetical protein